MQIRKQTQAGVARAKIVDYRGETKRPISFERNNFQLETGSASRLTNSRSSRVKNLCECGVLGRDRPRSPRYSLRCWQSSNVRRSRPEINATVVGSLVDGSEFVDREVEHLNRVQGVVELFYRACAD